MKLEKKGQSTDRSKKVKKLVNQPLTLEEMKIALNIKDSAHNRSTSQENIKLGSPNGPLSHRD